MRVKRQKAATKRHVLPCVERTIRLVSVLLLAEPRLLLMLARDRLLHGCFATAVFHLSLLDCNAR